MEKRPIYCEDACRNSLEFCRYVSNGRKRLSCEGKFNRCISDCRDMALRPLEKEEEASGA